ncbi:unnamed protein product [Rangifer tarandus platyrhynchus]|uniref:Uncharacterized protein n=2 Tax=Rangifer tarandus platyrhynchus TaxID=3082113 RepID=A0ACB0ETX1_RANTA|nr:unnamed protein product [Rangifer tarandus platyrhynchus]CAI9703797.1 unnamed protein product [Rangifer tarandus platyrhynchus]
MNRVGSVRNSKETNMAELKWMRVRSPRSGPSAQTLSTVSQEAPPPRKSHLNCSSHGPEAEMAASHCPWGLEPLACRSHREVRSAGLHDGPRTLKGLPTAPGPAAVPYG